MLAIVMYLGMKERMSKNQIRPFEILDVVRMRDAKHS